MKTGTSLKALSVATLGVFVAPALAEADTASEIKALKARLQQLETQVAKQSQEAKEAKAQARHATNVANAAKGEVVKGDPKFASLPPVFVSLKNGLTIETADGDYNFHIGGRVHVAGSAVSEPLNGYNSQVGIRRARIQVEGKAKSWFYKAQYDFGATTTTIYPGLRLDNNSTVINTLYGNTYVTQSNQVLQGIRDFYFGYQGPLTAFPYAKNPAFIIVGNQFEPFSLEAVTSSNYIDLAERSMATDVFSPARHIGAAIGGYGDNWSAKAGIFSTSPEDANINPARFFAQNGVLQYTVPFPSTTGSSTRANWWSNWGGANYFDVTGRLTYAPIRDEHNLLHVGISGRYHQVNQATGFNDDRVLVLGNRSRSEDFFSGQQLLGTPDLSCGVNVQPIALVTPAGTLSTSTGAGGCTKNVETLNAEFFGSYGPFSLQGEYYASWYNRSSNALLRDTAVQVVNPANGLINPNATYFNPGGTSLFFSGYYAQAQYWLTGEEKVSAYRTDDKAGASFRQIRVKQPLSAGGWGAWGLTGRLSSVDLNYGPYSGQNLYNALWWTQNAPGIPTATRVALWNRIANAGVSGGLQQNVTVGLNWLPEEGIQIQANWTRVVNLKAPLNEIAAQSYYSGRHPNLFQIMTKVYW